MKKFIFKHQDYKKYIYTYLLYKNISLQFIIEALYTSLMLFQSGNLHVNIMQHMVNLIK